MKKWIIVAIFAMAFAAVEAAVVIYLRGLLKTEGIFIARGKNDILFLLPGIAFLSPETALNIIRRPEILGIERAREAATIIMLLTVGFLAGNNWKTRLAYFLTAFGIWDIFYYVFLRLWLFWPTSLLDLDVLFLLPVPWIGPVIVPVLISLIMIGAGILIIKIDKREASNVRREEKF